MVLELKQSCPHVAGLNGPEHMWPFGIEDPALKGGQFLSARPAQSRGDPTDRVGRAPELEDWDIATHEEK